MTFLSLWELKHIMSMLNEHDCPVCNGIRKKLEPAIAELEVILSNESDK